jgi:hypothetical protein
LRIEMGTEMVLPSRRLMQLSALRRPPAEEQVTGVSPLPQVGFPPGGLPVGVGWPQVDLLVVVGLPQVLLDVVSPQGLLVVVGLPQVDLLVVVGLPQALLVVVSPQGLLVGLLGSYKKG